MDHPNIVYILADDLGYGDVRYNDAACKIPTPNLDRLAERGMRFTDAHAGSSVCTPSRYNLLTGRYAWRSRLKRRIVWPWDGSLIEPERLTVASFLREAGYRTTCIGKWHLGWDWPTYDGRHPNETLEYGVNVKPARVAFAAQVDFSQRIAGGPVDRGFDTYFGVDVPNFPPYAWFEDDRLTELPTTHKSTEQAPPATYGQPGPAVPGWSHERMIPEFTRRAVREIETSAATGPGEQPLFLYLPLTSPHSPIVPNTQFQGMSGIGAYGDFVCETDWVVGQIMDAVDRAGVADNTLLIFTSDNGPEDRTPDDEGVYARLRTTGHASMGPLRGIKRDAWEGGHRVPMLAAWPQLIPAGARCDQTVCLGDLISTCADLIDTSLPEGAGPDSVSMLPLLRGQNDHARDHIVHHSAGGTFAIRQGNWVYIEAPSGGDNPEPDQYRRDRGYQPHDRPAELYDLTDDLPQRHNRYAQHPDVAIALHERLTRIKAGDSSN